MEFWSRLRGGAKDSRRKSLERKGPAQRLAIFEKVYHLLLQTWQNDSSQSQASTNENLRNLLQKLNTIIRDETRTPSPHPCLEFAANNAIYAPISRIAVASRDEAVIFKTIRLFSELIDSEEEDLWTDQYFASTLIVFVEAITPGGKILVGEQNQCEMVELLFGIAAKIRSQPEFLRTWFNGKPSGAEGDNSTREGNVEEGQSAETRDSTGVKSSFAGITQKNDFPLCYQLIDNIHNEGRIGDFARTGLLYLFESCSRSKDLEGWIFESDLPTLMASGLGALYSQLSRKLSLVRPKEYMPVTLALSEYSLQDSHSDAESLFSPTLQGHLRTFLTCLVFWQDVLERCSSEKVRHTLIEHFRVLFLQQLLYPSLLESSDADGGSSVAVLTYLYEILRALGHPELIHMILSYLLALKENTSLARALPSRIQERSKSKLLWTIENEDDRASPAEFNLFDLILNSVRSNNTQTVAAALKLVKLLLSKHHEYVVDSLYKADAVGEPNSGRTFGALNQELDEYMAVASNLGVDPGMDEAYENHIRDTFTMVESHCCFARVLPDSGGSIEMRRFLNSDLEEGLVKPHSVCQDDLFFKPVLGWLKNFLLNAVEVNLDLTELIITLACCQHVKLQGWLVFSPEHYKFAPPNSSDDSQSSPVVARIREARRGVTCDEKHKPWLLRTLHIIEGQLGQLRSGIPSFDQMVSERREIIRTYSRILSLRPEEIFVPEPGPPDSSSISGSQRFHLRKGPLNIFPGGSQSPFGSLRGVSSSFNETISSHAVSGTQSILQHVRDALDWDGGENSGSPRGNAAVNSTPRVSRHASGNQNTPPSLRRTGSIYRRLRQYAESLSDENQLDVEGSERRFLKPETGRIVNPSGSLRAASPSIVSQSSSSMISVTPRAKKDENREEMSPMSGISPLFYPRTAGMGFITSQWEREFEECKRVFLQDMIEVVYEKFKGKYVDFWRGARDGSSSAETEQNPEAEEVFLVEIAEECPGSPGERPSGGRVNGEGICGSDGPEKMGSSSEPDDGPGDTREGEEGTRSERRGSGSAKSEEGVRGEQSPQTRGGGGRRTFGPDDENGGPAKGTKTRVALNHVLTNVVTLQEFVLETVAMIQVRAGLFGEVKMS